MNRISLRAFGFARLSRLETELIDALAGPDSAVYLPYAPGMRLFEEAETTREILAQRGWTVEMPEDVPRTAGQVAADALLGLRQMERDDRIRVWSFSTPLEEVRGVLREIKKAIVEGDISPHEVVLVSRSESLYGPHVAEVGQEYGIPIHTHYAVSVLNTRFGQWMRDLLEVVLAGDFPFEATARLVHHPISAGLRGDLWSEERWNSARAIHARGAEEWRSLDLRIEKLGWPDLGSRSQWKARILRLLGADELNVVRICGGRAQDVEAYEKLLEVLDLLALPGDEEIERAEFISQLREGLRSTTVAANLERSGVEFHTPLSLFGSEAAHVYVLGAAEGVLPPPSRDNSLLDYHDRRKLAEQGVGVLESAAQAARREMLSFYALLLAARDTLTFSFPRMRSDQATLPGPFLERMGLHIEPRDDAIVIAASRAELLSVTLMDPLLDADAMRVRRSRDIVYSRETGAQMDEYTGAIGISCSAEDRTFTPGQITVLGQCPYRWFGQSVLKIAEPLEAEDDLAPSTKGELFHAVLSRAVKAAAGSKDLRVAVLQRLERDFDAVAATVEWAVRAAAWKSRRPELLDQLRRAVEGEMFLMDGATVFGTETDFRGEWNGLAVRGRIDRIDRIGEQLYVIDYKSSASSTSKAKDDAGKLNLDVQLPIYMTAGVDAVTGRGNAAGGYYYSLSKAEVLTSYTTPGASTQRDIPEGALSQLANRLRGHLSSGAYPVSPDTSMDACNTCELDMVCRRGPHIERARGSEP